MTATPRLPLANASEILMAAREKCVPTTPHGADKIATILSREAKALESMDRYERRALSRRKFAVRAFDAARRHKLTSRMN
jgi:hypothetical protein